MSYKQQYILPDVLDYGLKVVFCGTAAGTASAKAGAYYAGSGNRFWQSVYYIGLTPYPFKPENFQDVIRFGIGLTDLAKHTFGQDIDLSPSDFDDASLRDKIRKYTPKVLAFTSKNAAKAFFHYPSVQYGLHSSMIDSTQVFVLPSPSGAARGFWDISHWYDLAAIVKQAN